MCCFLSIHLFTVLIQVRVMVAAKTGSTFLLLTHVLLRHMQIRWDSLFFCSAPGSPQRRRADNTSKERGLGSIPIRGWDHLNYLFSTAAVLHECWNTNQLVPQGLHFQTQTSFTTMTADGAPGTLSISRYILAQLRPGLYLITEQKLGHISIIRAVVLTWWLYINLED